MEVVCCLLMQNGRVLLAQRPSHKNHPLHWEFPGGKKMESESLVDALIRELHEELKIQICSENIQSIGVIDHDGIRLHLFSAALAQPYLPTEHQAVAWVEFSKIKNFLLCPSDAKSLDLIGSKIEALFTNP